MKVNKKINKCEICGKGILKMSKRCVQCLSLRHGHYRNGKPSPTYKSWSQMTNRCTNPNAHNWKWYGGIGIKIDKKWRDFSIFLEDMGERPQETTLDRINPKGDYCKENCRWATKKEQMRNMNTNVVFNGETAVEASLRLSRSPCLVSGRLHKGWSKVRAFTQKYRFR